MTDTVLNTKPIYSSAPIIGLGGTTYGTAIPLQTANTAKDGTGTVHVAFVADAVNGGRIERLKAQGIGTNVATVLRIFINNGGTNTVATNNVLFVEQTIAATTLTETAGVNGNEVILNLALPAGYRILCTIGTTIAAGLMITGIGGKY